MKNLLLTSILLFLSLSGFGQNQDDLKIEVLKGAKPWTSLKLNNDSPNKNLHIGIYEHFIDTICLFYHDLTLIINKY